MKLYVSHEVLWRCNVDNTFELETGISLREVQSHSQMHFSLYISEQRIDQDQDCSPKITGAYMLESIRYRFT